MKKTLLFTLINSALFAAGYQVPNSTVNSNALATAYVANANGADAAYFNPANMVYNGDNHEIEASLLYVSLPSFDYNPSNGGDSIGSKEHKVVVPSLHYASPKLLDTNLRIGFSISTPYGLTREWDDQPALASAKHFSLKTVEFNPSIAYAVSSKLSIALGLRYVIASGEVKLDYNPYKPLTIDMEGDANDIAYNLALSYKATDNLQLALTYRSAITLKLDGTSTISHPQLPNKANASLEVAIPDNLILAAAYTFDGKTTVEITYDKTFWSDVTQTDFEYTNPVIEAVLGTPVPKLWNDTEAYRLGLTHKYNNTLTLMSGIAYSTNAADEQYVSFSSPEADSMTYSLGGRYILNKDIELGMSLLYAVYDDRTSNQATNPLGVNGTFTDKTALSLALGVSYKF